MALFAGNATGVPDAIMLDTIDERSFMANLKARFDKQQCYTYIGEVVVSVNPYSNLNIYGPDKIRQYRGREVG